MDLVIVLLSLVLLVLVGAGLWLSFRLFLINLNRVSLNILVVVLFMDFWVLSKLFSSFIDFFPSFRAIETIIGSIGPFTGITGAIFLSKAFDQPFLDKKTRFSALVTLSLFLILFGVALTDLFLPSPIFFDSTYQSGEWQHTLHPLTLILVILGILLFLVTFVFAFKSIRMMPDYLISEKSLKLAVLMAVISLVVCVGGLVLFLDLPALFVLCLTALISSFTLLLPYISQDQPFLLLGGGFQPNLMLERGYLGYCLSSWSELGPCPILFSSEFGTFANVSEADLLLLSVKAATTLGGDKSIGLVPIPNHADLLALVVTFPIKNHEFTDRRFREGVPSQFAILFPSVMSIALNRINRVLPIVLKKVNQKEDIKALADHNYLQEMAIAALKCLLE
ncbi:MAG: hypothetical protein ACFFBD_09520 [Candidatus Hodarchaeota archaeon]